MADLIDRQAIVKLYPPLLAGVTVEASEQGGAVVRIQTMLCEISFPIDTALGLSVSQHLAEIVREGVAGA